MLHQELGLPIPGRTGGPQLSGPWVHRGDSSWNLLSLSTVATLILPQALILPPRPTYCHLLWEVFPIYPSIMAPDLILEHHLHQSPYNFIHVFLFFS